ncbi:MAG TPA: hypothetical protein VD866_06805 [Urbifossiella sp.]|nr:hypothetical protein [Urbifossiella sp.]
MPLPAEFQVTENDGILRVEWDNRRVAKGTWVVSVILWLGVGFFIWAGVDQVARWLASGAPEPYEPGMVVLAVPVVLLFVWLFAYSIPLSLLARTWRERIEVSREALTHTWIGRYAPGPTVYPVTSIDAIMLGWYKCGPYGSTDWISIYLLRRDRCFYGGLVAWLAQPLQARLFFTIRDFVEANGIPLKLGEWGKRPEWAVRQGIVPAEVTSPERV